jgi:hypothetical protein
MYIQWFFLHKLSFHLTAAHSCITQEEMTSICNCKQWFSLFQFIRGFCHYKRCSYSNLLEQWPTTLRYDAWPINIFCERPSRYLTTPSQLVTWQTGLCDTALFGVHLIYGLLFDVSGAIQSDFGIPSSLVLVWQKRRTLPIPMSYQTWYEKPGVLNSNVDTLISINLYHVLFYIRRFVSNMDNSSWPVRSLATKKRQSFRSDRIDSIILEISLSKLHHRRLFSAHIILMTLISFTAVVQHLTSSASLSYAPAAAASWWDWIVLRWFWWVYWPCLIYPRLSCL